MEERRQTNRVLWDHCTLIHVASPFLGGANFETPPATPEYNRAFTPAPIA